MHKSDRPQYSMSVVRKKTGLTDRQIRYYEEVGLINPRRTRGNQRIFSSQEIDRLFEIKSLLTEGLTIEGIKEQFAEKIELPLDYPYQPQEKVLPGMRKGLTSLYPVSNRAHLVEMIVQRKGSRLNIHIPIKDEECSDEKKSY